MRSFCMLPIHHAVTPLWCLFNKRSLSVRLLFLFLFPFSSSSSPFLSVSMTMLLTLASRWAGQLLPHILTKLWTLLWMESRLWSPWEQRAHLIHLSVPSSTHNAWHKVSVEHVVNWIEVLMEIYHVQVAHCSCEDPYIYSSIFTWKIYFRKRSFKITYIMLFLYALYAFLSQEYFIDSNSLVTPII